MHLRTEVTVALFVLLGFAHRRWIAWWRRQEVNAEPAARAEESDENEENEEELLLYTQWRDFLHKIEDMRLDPGTTPADWRELIPVLQWVDEGLADESLRLPSLVGLARKAQEVRDIRGEDAGRDAYGPHM